MKKILLSLLIITLLLATACNSQVNTEQNETRSEAESITDNKTAEGSGSKSMYMKNPSTRYMIPLHPQ